MKVFFSYRRGEKVGRYLANEKKNSNTKYKIKKGAYMELSSKERGKIVRNFLSIHIFFQSQIYG